MKIQFSLLLFLNIICTNTYTAETPPSMFFCMAADQTYYWHLRRLIKSIHKFNFNELGEIAVFDLGFTQKQRDKINSIAKVRVYDVEPIHPNLLTYFITNIISRYNH